MAIATFWSVTISHGSNCEKQKIKHLKLSYQYPSKQQAKTEGNRLVVSSKKLFGAFELHQMCSFLRLISVHHRTFTNRLHKMYVILFF